MANTPQFVPTAENTYVISYPIHGTDAAYDFAAILARSRTCERQGDGEQACSLRYEGVKKLMDLIPDEDEVQLDWEEEENQSVLELLKRSAIDHFLVGDFEMAAGMMEMLLDMDPEDHLETTKPLAFCYLALEDYELFDEIVNDMLTASRLSSRKTHRAAPRLSASMPSWPLPAYRSSTRAPGRSNCTMLNIASFTCERVGRVTSVPGSASSLRPRASPAITRMMLPPCRSCRPRGSRFELFRILYYLPTA